LKSHNSDMISEIGGEFSIAPTQICWKSRLGKSDPFFSGEPKPFLLADGRAALRLIFTQVIKPSVGDEMLLPAYLFDELLEPFRESRATIRFYKINRDLTLDLEDIKTKINPRTKILYLIHYFGFPQPLKSLTEIKEKYPDCVIIEDLAQAFLSAWLDSSLGRFGDFGFNTFRKVVGVTAGSMLWSKKPIQLKLQKYQFKNLLLNDTRYLAMNLKNLYLKSHIIPKSWYLGLFGFTDSIIDENKLCCEMSWLSKRLIRSYDYPEIIAIRRRNFAYLLDHWHFKTVQPLFKELPASVCPLGFFVLSQNRDVLRKELSKRNIYCPIHWTDHPKTPHAMSPSISREEFPISWELAGNIMMIPTDQRYGQREMQYILDKVQELEKMAPAGNFDQPRPLAQEEP
jgi:dTDP-4-amino-4,6-dideoxygalactose transaminase